LAFIASVTKLKLSDPPPTGFPDVPPEIAPPVPPMNENELPPSKVKQHIKKLL
jgi:hypothetical protein